MIKKMFTCLISIALIVTSSTTVFADEKTDEMIVDDSNGYVTTIQYNDNGIISVNTYENNVVVYASSVKENGNIYMQIDGHEVLAVVISNILKSETDDPEFSSLPLRKAPSSFILTSSGAVQHIKITGDVIDAGQAAIRNALIGALFSWGGVTAHITGATVGALGALVDYIWTHYTTYDANVIRNSYVYNGCTWLLYNEFVYPEGYTVGTYGWTDNPSLGIAPYTCKIASQTYPY